jgi:60 kDa SS-A/Ro ribonucleoprotein
MLTALPLTTDHWTGIASDAKWHMTRMNLNTFARHGVFTKSPEMVDMVASRLKDEKAIAKSKVFPYQLFAAYKQTLTNAEVPTKVKNALQDAMEISVKNVPNFGGKKIAVGVDISGSMRCAITGNRGSVTSQIMCNDVAALFAAALLRANEDTTSVFQFDTRCKPMKNLNARDSIMTNLSKIAFNGGGTDCSSTIRYLIDHNINSDLVVIVSDNMSWIDMSGHYLNYGQVGNAGTAMATAWALFKKINPKAKLVCLDLVPQTHVQVKPQADVLCVGGFSDNVFDVIKAFADNTNNDPDFFVKTIQESV